MLIDGATGTLLGERGVETRGPLFSAQALLDDWGLELLREIHREYAEAGAQLVTAATFRTNPRKAGTRWREMTSLAVKAAKSAGVKVAGSMAPVEDCYRPELRPGVDVALREHARMAQALAEEGCDVLLVETVCSSEEGLVAVDAARATGLPVWVSALAMPDGRMRDGTDLLHFFDDARIAGASAALINCVPCDGVDLGLRAAALSGLPYGGYAHIGNIDPASGWIYSAMLSPREYALRAKRWIDRGASVIGGCCGTTPSHIEELGKISPPHTLAGLPLRSPAR
jgi:S-methylmethionine-dependent homocysteine/selenocysteine methylase